MLYEMVTGKLVFNGPTLTAVLAQHLNEMPPPPDHARPDLGIPPGLSALVMRCLAKSPDQRPASMEVVKAELATLRGQLGWSPMAAPMGPAPAPVPAYGAAAVPTPAPPPPLMSPPPMSFPPPPVGGQTLKAGPRPAGAPSRLWLGVLGVGVVMIVAAIVIGRVQWQWDPEIPEAEGAVPEGEDEDDDGDDGEGASGAEGTAATPPAALGMTDQDLGKLFGGGGGGGGGGGLTSNPSGFGGKSPAPAPTGALGGGAGSMTNGKFGYTIDLPAGFASQPSTDESTMAMGTIDGKPALIVTFAQPADGSLFTDEAMDGLGDAVISNANARLVRKTKRRVGGRDLLAIIADMDQVGMRVEMVMFIRPTFILAVAVGAQKDGFDRTASMRDRFFTQSVRFGGSAH
jgi:hypothetical protein